MNGAFVSCSGLACNPLQIVRRWFSYKAGAPNWFQIEDRDVVMTYQARTAIALLCEIMGVRSGDEVLLPSFNCGAEIDPFLRAGAKLVFYKVDGQARLDVQDIFRRVGSRTRLVYVTHYFGWPQAIAELKKWCDSRGLFLVEDCALSLFSNGAEKSLGRIGDAAIYSFTKCLGVPDGGALVIKRGMWKERMRLRRPDRKDTLLRSLPLVKRWVMQQCGGWQKTNGMRNLVSRSWLAQGIEKDKEGRRLIPESSYYDERKRDWDMSGVSRSLLATAKPERIVERRRQNYKYLYENLVNVRAVEPLFDGLPDEVCPLAFPMKVEDRDRWERGLSANGILVGGWPGYHREFGFEDFPETRNLKSNLVTLPVHHDLDVRHMRHIVSCVEALAQAQW